MGRFVAIGGGTFEETDALNKKILDMSGKKVPNILFIGTAAKDSTNPLTSAKKSFKRVCPGVVVKKLSLIRSVYTEEQINELISWADVIYVCGGDTCFMLDIWRTFGLDKRLKKAFDEDTHVLSGMSAGAICWFTDGYTDADFFTGSENWSCKLIKPGIDLYEAVFCPHYQNWERKGFDETVKTTKIKGIALTDNAAFVYNNGETCYWKSQEDAKAYELTLEDGVVKKTEMEATPV